MSKKLKAALLTILIVVALSIVAILYSIYGVLAFIAFPIAFGVFIIYDIILDLL